MEGRLALAKMYMKGKSESQIKLYEIPRILIYMNHDLYFNNVYLFICLYVSNVHLITSEYVVVYIRHIYRSI